MDWTITALWVALGLTVSALAAPPAAAADLAAPEEAVSTGSGEAPKPEPSSGPETVDPLTAFQRLGPARDAAPGDGRCVPPEDRKPHGEVWGAVGTQDYRAGGVSVEMPVGDCARVAVSISGSKGGPYGYGPDAPYATGAGPGPLNAPGAPVTSGRWIPRED